MPESVRERYLRCEKLEPDAVVTVVEFAIAQKISARVKGRTAYEKAAASLEESVSLQFSRD
jgi:hypothetical protein